MNNAIIVSISIEGLTVAAVTIIIVSAVIFALKIINYLLK